MWIFLNNAFLSVVQHRENHDYLMVRARRREDLERVFGDDAIVETAAADYRFRVVVSKHVFGLLLTAKVQEINYDNFKSSVAEPERHDAYMAVWQRMHQFQRTAVRPLPKASKRSPPRPPPAASAGFAYGSKTRAKPAGK